MEEIPVGEYPALFSVVGRWEGARNMWLENPVSPPVPAVVTPNQDALSTLEQGGWFEPKTLSSN